MTPVADWLKTRGLWDIMSDQCHNASSCVYPPTTARRCPAFIISTYLYKIRTKTTSLHSTTRRTTEIMNRRAGAVVQLTVMETKDAEVNVFLFKSQLSISCVSIKKNLSGARLTPPSPSHDAPDFFFSSSFFFFFSKFVITKNCFCDFVAGDEENWTGSSHTFPHDLFTATWQNFRRCQSKSGPSHDAITHRNQESGHVTGETRTAALSVELQPFLQWSATVLIQ